MSDAIAPGARPVIEGFADRLSYAPGEVVSIACSTSEERFSAEIARVGAEREIVFRSGELPGRWQRSDSDSSSTGCAWAESLRFEIPPGAPSGYYEIVLRATDERSGRSAEGLAFFVVRPVAGEVRPGAILLQLATNTYNAYNDWGGPSLYTGSARVSFRRPMAAGFLSKPEPHTRYPNVATIDDPEHEHFRSWADLHGLARWSGSAGWHNWERPFVRWAERQGYLLDFAVNSDLEAHPEVVGGHRLVLSVGHDEYWSWGMRDTLEAHIAGGGNVAFFSGNAVFWQIRYEDGHGAMVCHKGHEQDPLWGTDRQHLVTTMWSSPIIRRPENELTGVSFSRGGYVRMGRAVPRASGGYTAWRPGHWAFRGTGLSYGDLFGTKDSVVVYEVDGCELAFSPDDGLPVPTGRDGTPESFTVLATAPARLWSRDELPSRYRADEAGDLETTAEGVFGDASEKSIARVSHNHAVMGTYTRGGTVFTVGTTDWAYGLAGHDPDIERITENVLDRLS